MLFRDRDPELVILGIAVQEVRDVPAAFDLAADIEGRFRPGWVVLPPEYAGDRHGGVAEPLVHEILLCERGRLDAAGVVVSTEDQRFFVVCMLRSERQE